MGNGGFVIRVLAAAVIRNQRHPVRSRQVPEDVKGTDFPAGIDRQQFARFDPKDAQSVYQQIPS